MKPIPLIQQIKCVEREIGLRQRVYPGWVVQRRLSREEADYQIAAMQAVLETLQRGRQGELFDGARRQSEPLDSIVYWDSVEGA